MVPLHALWLPILLSSVIVFVASSIIHMVLPVHKSDYRKLPDEASVLDNLRASGVTPGREYRFPYCTQKEMKSPEAIEKFKRGPVGLLVIMPTGVMNMGKFLGEWFLYCMVVSIFAAYVAGRTRAPGAEYLEVFSIAGVTAFIGYSLAQAQNSIWRGVTWGVTLKHMLDGLIFGLLTAGTFGWLWPKY